MNAITPRRPLTVRLASGTLAVMMGLGIVSVLSQSLHVERFGHGAPLVQLAPVTVTATPAVVDTTTFAAAPSTTRAN
jgi:hypothetical protein